MEDKKRMKGEGGKKNVREESEKVEVMKGEERGETVCKRGRGRANM